MIAIIDYGMGNLRSVQKALEASGASAKVTQNAQEIEEAERVVLPGVGAMEPAMRKLDELGLIDTIRSQALKKPFLGICLGLQLMFETSDEGGHVAGLGILKGNVKRFQSGKVPQIGWNQLKIRHKDCPLYKGIGEGSFVYFCHSYFVQPVMRSIVATQTPYGVNYASSVWQDNLFGVQFHPEKSQRIGLRILKNFTKVRP
jgi:glutamine amidotransferase